MVAGVTSKSNDELKSMADRRLDYLLSEWAGIPDVADNWERMDVIEKEVYQMEWAIPAGDLKELQEIAKRGLLTPAQQARFDELKKLIEKNTPILERLFSS